MRCGRGGAGPGVGRQRKCGREEGNVDCARQRMENAPTSITTQRVPFQNYLVV